eukprot:CAMPEP_0182433856 /NCGR_PEP_ID=MMETSP1167-20130531/66002_1 /TAXON_ID=2988 /ORGANISM="Mallomonas Sp, Strain CCMP3275" /LENGTH=305 /DNA_ID=CAMNT_0024623051 /DNA_START=255 /DNA_END=1169 /DNA_ORIENTATION=-
MLREYRTVLSRVSKLNRERGLRTEEHTEKLLHVASQPLREWFEYCPCDIVIEDVPESRSVSAGAQTEDRLMHSAMTRFLSGVGWKPVTKTSSVRELDMLDLHSLTSSGRLMDIDFTQDLKSHPAIQWVQDLPSESQELFLSLPREASSAQLEMILLAVLSDLMRIILLSFYILVQKAWQGSDISLAHVHDTFSQFTMGESSIIDRKLIQDIQKWLALNRRTDAAFNQIDMSYIELVLRKLVSFWPQLTMTRSISNEEKQPTTSAHTFSKQNLEVADCNDNKQIYMAKFTAILQWQSQHKVAKLFH